MSFWQKLGNGLKKIVPIASAAANFIPGVGPLISKGISTVSKMWNPDDGGMGAPNAGPQLPQVTITGQQSQGGLDWGKISSAAGALGSSLANYYGQQSTNAANAKQAQEMMAFQERMSNTAYQRGTQDMIKAGLNPALGYSQGGASTPGGSQAQMGNELGAGANSALSALQTFQALDQVKAQTDLMYAQRDKVDAETLDALEQPAYTRARTGDTKASEEYRKVDTAFQQMRLRLAEETFRDNVSSAHSSAQIARNQAQGGLYDLSKSKVYSDFYNTKIGKEEPLIKLGGEAISNAGDLFGKFFRRGR